MAFLSSFVNQQCPPASEFSVDDIPDLSGKVVLVTGGNSGIGYEIAKAVLNRNAKVYIACRDQAKAEDAITRLSSECGGKTAIFHHLDLANLSAVKLSAESFLQKERRLHVLFNNAGIMEPPIKLRSADGYDLTLATNLLGPFQLTQSLLPALLAVQEHSASEQARVVSTSCGLAEMAKRVDFNAFSDERTRNKLGIAALYFQSKRGIVMFSNELARRYDGRIVSIALNPGNVFSNIHRNVPKVINALVTKLLLHPTPMGALTPLYAGTSVQGENFNGKYLAPWAREYVNPATDEKSCGDLWNFMEEAIKKVA